MAKPKFHIKAPQNLITIQLRSTDRLDDKQIAAIIGYNETYFSELKGKIPELSKALKNGRAPLELKVENTLYTKATGMKVKVQQAIKVKDVYYDEEGRRTEKESKEKVELEQEIPPDTRAGIFCLKSRKPEQWNKPAPRIDEDADIPIDINHGISIDSWIKDKLK